jgi:hypothetical protein
VEVEVVCLGFLKQMKFRILIFHLPTWCFQHYYKIFQVYSLNLAFNYNAFN